MADRPSGIGVGQFVRRLRQRVDSERDFRIVWLLGAGCSVTSKIPTAAGPGAAVARGSCLVFCGYGGNDHSVAELVRTLPRDTLDWGIYWVGEEFPDCAVTSSLMARHEKVTWVGHHGFDYLMLEVAQEFKLDLPALDRFKTLKGTYRASLNPRSTTASLDAHPSDPDNLGNYAQLLFVQGRDDEVQALVERGLAAGLSPDGELELAFCRYAHIPEQRDTALAELHRLLGLGVRSPAWNLSANVDRGSEDGHPEPGLLEDLARVIAEEVPADVLDAHPAWRSPAGAEAPSTDDQSAT